MTDAATLKFPVADAGPGHNNPPVEDPVVAKLKEAHGDLLAKADKFVEACGRCPLPTDEETATKVTDFVKQVGTVTRALEDTRKDAKNPYLEAGRKVDGLFKAHTDALAEAIAPIRKSLDAYVAELDRKRRAEEAAERRRIEEEQRRAEEERQAQAALDNSTEEEAVPEPTPAPVVVPQTQKAQVRGDLGTTASARKTWAFEIEDQSKIPVAILRRYLTQDAIEKAVRAAVRQGERDIKGVRIFETVKAQVR